MSGIFDQVINYAPPSLLLGTVTYKGAWSAATNTPTLINPPDSTTNGFYYVVSAAGTQFSLVFNIGDWIISNGSAWQKVDNTDAVDSVFGRTGAVVGVSTDYSAVGITNTALGASNPSTVAATTITATSTIAATGAVTGSNLSGTNTGNQTITLTGGVTGSGTGSFAATVITNANLTGGVTSVGNAATVVTNANLTGGVTSVGNATTVITNANLTGGVTSVGNAATVITNANLTGDVTSVGNATTLTNAPVIAKVLTGYTSGAGTVAATDSILQAIQKLNGNDATNANLTGVITSVGNATSIASQTGTGTKFVVDTSPTLITPNIGVATGTSLAAALNGTLGATTPSSVAATTGTFSSTLGVTGVATLGNGAILGTPASGTVTNLTGTASININGTVGATTPSTGAFSTLSATSTLSTTPAASANAVQGSGGSFVTVVALPTGWGTVHVAVAENGTTNIGYYQVDFVNGTGVAIQAKTGTTAGATTGQLTFQLSGSNLQARGVNASAPTTVKYWIVTGTF